MSDRADCEAPLNWNASVDDWPRRDQAVLVYFITNLAGNEEELTLSLVVHYGVGSKRFEHEFDVHREEARSRSERSEKEARIETLYLSIGMGFRIGMALALWNHIFTKGKLSLTTSHRQLTKRRCHTLG